MSFMSEHQNVINTWVKSHFNLAMSQLASRSVIKSGIASLLKDKNYIHTFFPSVMPYAINKNVIFVANAGHSF